MEKVVPGAAASKPQRLMYQGIGSKIMLILFGSTSSLSVFDFLFGPAGSFRVILVAIFGSLSFVSYVIWSCTRSKAIVSAFGQSIFTYGFITWYGIVVYVIVGDNGVLGITNILHNFNFNYDDLVESAFVVSLFGFFFWKMKREAIRSMIGQILVVYSTAVIIPVYLMGYVVWSLGLVHSGGPYSNIWWTEQLTYQTCFIKAPNYGGNAIPNCMLLNYGDAFITSVLLLITGLVLWRYYRSGTQTRRSEIKSIAVSLSGGTQT